MRCEEIRGMMAGDLAGSLTEAESRLQEHLVECSHCREEFADLKAIWANLAQAEVPLMELSRVRTVVLDAAQTIRTPTLLKWRFDMRQLLKAFAAILVVAALATGTSLLLVKRKSVDAAPHVRGSLNAAVSLVEYGDYECPPCASFERILRQYVEQHPGELKVEYRHFPLTALHPNAMAAAKAAEAANAQGKFWMMHDALMDSQSKWARRPDAETFFLQLAQEAGLDMKQYRESLRSPELESRIQSDIHLANQNRVQGAPTLFLNGRKVSEAPRTLEALHDLIAGELRH